MSFPTFTRQHYDFGEQQVLESEMETVGKVRIGLNASNLPDASVRVQCGPVEGFGFSADFTVTPAEARALADELNVAADAAQGISA